jgi:hypothetical protein
VSTKAERKQKAVKQARKQGDGAVQLNLDQDEIIAFVRTDRIPVSLDVAEGMEHAAAGFILKSKGTGQTRAELLIKLFHEGETKPFARLTLKEPMVQGPAESLIEFQRRVETEIKRIQETEVEFSFPPSGLSTKAALEWLAKMDLIDLKPAA